MKKEHYVVFGATDKPNKVLTAMVDPETKASALHIGELREGSAETYGQEVTADDIVSSYTTLIFCKRESLDAFADVIRRLQDALDKEDTNEGDKTG